MIRPDFRPIPEWRKQMAQEEAPVRIDNLEIQIYVCMSEHGGFGHGNHSGFCPACREAIANQTLTLQDLIDANRARCERWHGVKDWTPLEWAGAMCGEAGEAANAAKKLKRIESGISNINEEPGRSLTDVHHARARIGLEVADTFIYGVLLGLRVEVDLVDCVRKAFNQKSEEYGFPERI